MITLLQEKTIQNALTVLNGILKNLSREREVHVKDYAQLTLEERFTKAEIARVYTKDTLKTLHSIDKNLKASDTAW